MELELIKKSNLGNNNGVALIMALLIITVLSIIGITTLNLSRLDIITSGIEKFSKIAFEAAESGKIVTIPIINNIIDNDIQATDDPDFSLPSGVTLIDTVKLLREIRGLDGSNTAGGTNDPDDADSSPDFQIANPSTNIDLDLISRSYNVGGSIEFASGYEGIGGGAAGGGISLFYRIDSIGQGVSDTKSNIEVVYRKVLGVGGGG
jgi:hypothetical protein